MESFVFVLTMLAFTVLGVGCSIASSEDYDVRDLLRKKRTLLFPDPLKSETKVQVLFGLGLPMEGEISMTLGYVLKCNYKLPYNSSDFTEGGHLRRSRGTEGSEVPEDTEDSIRDKGVISRWSLYRILEMALESSGSTGKACLLRSVCEAAETPFANESRGLLGQLLRVLLSPSSTDEPYELYSDREYSAAEAIGRQSEGHACRSLYPDCPRSPLDYFTKGTAIIYP